MSTSTSRVPLPARAVPGGETRVKRPAWRQRLIQAERGLAWGLRADSVFYVHFFGISIVLSAAVAFGIELWQWVAITLALTVVLSAEMFQQALKLLLHTGDQPAPPNVARALSIGTAAVLVACIGSCLVLTMIFVSRGIELFAD